MPQIWGVRCTGELSPWCSAKDVILEMLRRHGVKGGLNRIIEYHGPGWSTCPRWTATSSPTWGPNWARPRRCSPADDAVRAFLRAEDRGGDFTEFIADEYAGYDVADDPDPRDLADKLGLDYPQLKLPEKASVNTAMPRSCSRSATTCLPTRSPQPMPGRFRCARTSPSSPRRPMRSFDQSTSRPVVEDDERIAGTTRIAAASTGARRGIKPPPNTDRPTPARRSGATYLRRRAAFGWVSVL
jgi:hypothetical protein